MHHRWLRHAYRARHEVRLPAVDDDAAISVSGRLAVVPATACGRVVRVRPSVGQRGATMAGKDKGGRAAKTVASKTPKEKRQAKKEKKSKSGTSIL